MAEALIACFELPADPSAAGRARRLVSELLLAWRCAETVDVARLLVSEVVTNAVRFVGAGEPLQIGMEMRDRRIRVSVADTSPLRPVLKAPREDDESGRGMQLVAVLAAEWGVLDQTDDGRPGKQVWFELPAPEMTPGLVCGSPHNLA